MRFVISFLLVVTLAVSNLWGQSAIERSSEKVRIDGKVYYAHSVKKKETLYSLSKAYDVSINEIVKNNKHAATGIKSGMLLYIPVAETASSETAGNSQKTNAATDNAAPREEAPNAAANNKAYRKHTVKWFEDITDIAQKYNVSVEDIISLNKLKGSKLKSRQVLLIPNGSPAPERDVESADANYNNNPAVAEEVNGQPTDSSVTTTADTDNQEKRLRRRDWNEEIEIGYILPLNSKDTNNVNSNFMDFYAGSLLAINDFKNSGSSIKVNIYDQDSHLPLHTLIDEPGFEKNQLIIGPARMQDLATFAGYSERNGIPLVSPLDNNAENLADQNRHFIQMPANSNAQISNTVNLLERIKEAENASTVLLIYEKENNNDTLYVNSAKRLLESKGIEYIPVTYGILEGRNIYPKILSLVDTLSTNTHIALVPSNSEAFVSDVVRNLDMCTKSGAKVTLFGLPKWRNFETINVELFHKMRLHISLPYFVDYSNPEVKRFLLQYRALYSTEPTPFAYQGYDVTKYIMEQMLQYSTSFINANHIRRTAMLQSDFELRREESQSFIESIFSGEEDTATKGLKNCATRNIVYMPDYTISVIY